MTELKLAPIRKNAFKSTGPKTARGKATASRNALKHGLLSAAPVLPGIESPEEWEDHKAGIVESCAPVGYLQNVLAVRIALDLWRLWRVVRYEVEVTTASAATAKIDMETAKSRENDEKASRVAEMLEAIPYMPAAQKLVSEVAVAAFRVLQGRFLKSANVHDISIRGLPRDEAELDKFNDWTAHLLRTVLEAYAGAGGMSSTALLKGAIAFVRPECMNTKEEGQRVMERQQQWRLRLDRIIHGRMLLDPDVLDKVSRYESGLERSLFRNLHELQRLQAARSGVAVTPPAVVDEDLTDHN